MAGTKRHIDQELKAKLGKHTLPVMDSDWTAFEGFRRKRESKRRRTLYVIAAASLLFIALSGALICGALIWKSYESPGLIHSDKTETRKSPQEGTRQTEKSTDNEDVRSGERLETDEVPTHTKNQDNPVSDQSADKEELADGHKPSSASPIQDKPVTDGSRSPKSSATPEEAEIDRFPVISLFNIDSRAFMIPSPGWKWADRPAVTAYKKEENQDTSTLPGNQKRFGFPPLSTPSVALGFVYGFGNPTVSVNPIDSSRTHRQYEDAMKGAKQSSQVFRFFVQYEYRLKLGLEFGAGFELSSTSQVQKYKFATRDIPVFDTDGRIVHYFQAPNPIPREFESRQTITSASMPVSVGYAHTLKRINLRLGVRAQGSFGMNWSKGFTGLSPSTLRETTLDANINPFNMSYGGGLFGEYFYLRAWSMRVSLDWTAQNERYRKSNTYNINNRYYEFKLAIVKYL